MRLWLKAFLLTVAVLLGASALLVWAAAQTGGVGKAVIFTATNIVDVAGTVGANLWLLHQQSSDPSTPGADDWVIYAKSTGVFVRDDLGNIRELTGESGTGTGVGLTADFVTTTNMDLTGEETLEGILTNGNRVFTTGQSTPSQNGIWVSGSSGWTRAVDAAAGTSFAKGTIVTITNGIAGSSGNKGSSWVYTASGVYGTDNPAAIKSGLGPAGELLANKNANSGYLGLNSSGNATYDRIGSPATHSALAAANAITVSARQMGIEGSGGAVTLTSAPSIVAGTRDGTEVELIGTHATNTVTITNDTDGSDSAGSDVRLCGNTGSVTIGATRSSIRLRWNASLDTGMWQQLGCLPLQSAFNTHNTIVATETTPLKICNAAGTSCKSLYVDTSSGTPTESNTCAGGGCDQVAQIASGKDFLVKNSGGDTLVDVDEATGDVIITGHRERMVWDSDAMIPDGTHCTYSDTQTVGSGPIDNFIICTENASQQISLKKYRLAANYTGGTLGFVVHAMDVDSAGQVLAFNIEAQCRTPGSDAVNNTWSTGAAVSVTLTTANIPYASGEVEVTPNGSCVAGDWLFARLVANTGTNTDDGDARLMAVEAFYSVSKIGQ